MCCVASSIPCEPNRANVQPGSVTICCSQVLNILQEQGLPHDDLATRVMSSASLEVLHPAQTALLSSSIFTQLAAQLGPASQPAPCLTTPAACLLRTRLTQARIDCEMHLAQSMDLALEILKTAPTVDTQLLAQRDTCELVAAAVAFADGSAAVLPVTSCAAIRKAWPPAITLPHLLLLHTLRKQLLTAAREMYESIQALAHDPFRGLPAFEKRVTRLAQVQNVAELLPLRLAQWVAAATGQDMRAVVDRLMPRQEAVLQGVTPASLRRVYDINLAVLLDGELEGLQVENLERLSLQLRSQHASWPHVFVPVTGSAEFRALWGWSEDVCGRLVGELRAVSGGGGVQVQHDPRCSAQGQAGAQPQPSGSMLNVGEQQQSVGPGQGQEQDHREQQALAASEAQMGDGNEERQSVGQEQEEGQEQGLADGQALETLQAAAGCAAPAFLRTVTPEQLEQAMGATCGAAGIRKLTLDEHAQQLMELPVLQGNPEALRSMKAWLKTVKEGVQETGHTFCPVC